MNIENIDKLIDAIQTGNGHPELGFDMAYWSASAESREFIQRNYDEDTPDQSGRGCGTVHCMGGWCAILSGDYTPQEVRTDSMDIPFTTITAKFLGIPREVASDLVTPDRNNWRLIPLADGVRVLENLKLTGEVTWKIPAPNPVDTA